MCDNSDTDSNYILLEYNVESRISCNSSIDYSSPIDYIETWNSFPRFGGKKGVLRRFRKLRFGFMTLVYLIRRIKPERIREKRATHKINWVCCAAY